ncbi:alpha/beta fold hydrolase [Streptomyces sp. NBC_00344]|uniref:alpha/beta fold hydrolase n=1 Tax=Streptomyces sp. NBC_00344 TaxID=2975720 RepID=UPI002E24B298
MGQPRTATASVLTVAALVAGATFGLAPAAGAAQPDRAAPAAQASAGPEFHDIPGSGGITLKGNVFAPAGATARSAAKYPLIVLPASWAIPQIEYLAQAKKLADAGYVVVSYTARGFWGSGGRIETAGPPDIADVSSVIDWALAHTAADPRRIGVGGVSYGAGISLLAAGHDKRIKAVVAMSGWADLIDSIYSGRTEHRQAAALLGGLGEITGRPSAELSRTLKAFLGSDLSKEQEMIAWGKKRSPAAYLDRINKNGPAVMMGNAWGDTIFPPNSYAKFFDRLTGPKRLELRPGDHATAEATGLLGLPNDTWTDAHRWFDHYLKGDANGIDHEQPVQLASRTGGGYEGYPSWAAVPNSKERLSLDGTKEILTNVDSGADGGISILTNALDQFLRIPPLASIPLLPRAWAAVWQDGRHHAEQHIRGTATLHTTLTSTKESGTLVAYLYDVGPLGLGKLVSNAPYTFHGQTPGRPFPVDLDLFSTAYDVPAGHHLALVTDTVDPLYIEHNPTGAQLTFSSPESDPSYLSVPLREK